jgi:hypothetical protein
MNADPAATAIVEVAAYLRDDPSTSLAARVEWLRRGATRVTEAQLREVLSSRPELVEAWRSYSDDQRVSDGWYFLERESSGSRAWEVGQLSSGRRYAFDNAASACAAFVARIVGETITKWSQHES